MKQSVVQTRALRLGAVAFAVLLLSACANLAPTYQSPQAAIPAQFTQPTASSDGAGTPAADLDWRAFVTDARLRQTLALALDQSRDLRLAVLAVEQARAAYRIEDAASLPTLRANGGLSASRTPAEASSTGRTVVSRTYSANVGISSFELDFFGKVRNLQDAALQSFLQTAEARRSAQIALVAEVSTAWLTLAADRAQLALAQQTLQSERRTLEMTQQRRALGQDSGLTLAQVQGSVEAARRDVATYQSQVEQDINALELLVGASVPADWLPQANEPAAATLLVGVPAGLPSSVLQQRPDVLAAEHALQGANANIGAARAALYPSISLTTTLGTASRSLSDLFIGGAWSFLPSITLPIFDGGAGQAGVRQAEVTKDIRLATYDKTLQTAFREVADALSVRASLGERLAAQQGVVEAAQRAFDLSQASWRGGASSYLDVLVAQRTLYTAQQSLITLRLAEQGNRVTLFKVLGGGWQDGTTAAAASAG